MIHYGTNLPMSRTQSESVSLVTKHRRFLAAGGRERWKLPRKTTDGNCDVDIGREKRPPGRKMRQNEMADLKITDITVFDMYYVIVCTLVKRLPFLYQTVDLQSAVGRVRNLMVIIEISTWTQRYHVTDLPCYSCNCTVLLILPWGTGRAASGGTTPVGFLGLWASRIQFRR
jgi:hypothetical protein